MRVFSVTDPAERVPCFRVAPVAVLCLVEAQDAAFADKPTPWPPLPVVARAGN